MEYKKLGDICDILNGYAFKSDKYVESGIRIIRISNVQKGYIEDKTPAFYPINTVDIEKYMLSENDLLISLTGNVGRVALLDKKFLPSALNQRVACIRTKTDIILKEYLFYMMNSDFFENQCIQSSRGVAQKNMSTVWLENYEVPIYHKEVQLKIVRTLSMLMDIIACYHKQLEKYDELIKARFVEMFGDPLDKSRIKKKYIDCVDFNPKKSEIKNLLETMVSFVPMECVGTDGSFSVMRDGKIKEFYKGYTYFRDGDVLLAKITPCFENGKVAIAEHCTSGIGFGTTEFHVSRPIKGISNPYWIKYLLKEENLHNYATINMSGSAGQKRIQTPFFEKLEVYLPPIELQEQFADFVKQIDKSKFVVQKSLDKAQLLFDSLMQEYFG